MDKGMDPQKIAISGYLCNLSPLTAVLKQVIFFTIFLFFGCFFCSFSQLQATYATKDPLENSFKAHSEKNEARLNKDKERLKILFVVEKFPYSLQTFIINQIRGLIDRGHQVDIWASYDPDQQMVPELLPYNLLDKTFYGSFGLKRRSYDAILCQSASYGQRCLDAMKKKLLQGNLHVFFRGHDLTIHVMHAPQKYRDLFKQADLLLPVCDYYADLLKQVGAPAKKIMTLHSAIDCKKFHYKEREVKEGQVIRIVTVSRLVRMKGLESAIEAFAKISKNYENVEYTIVGDGALRDKLQEQVNELGLQDKIHLTGRLPHEEVVNQLDNAHIFFLPSVTTLKGGKEGIPNALKEAMAMGLPVVSTFHSGIPELIENGISGYLAEENNVDALAAHLKTLIENPHIWPQMGKAGRAKVEEEFELDKENDRLEKLLIKAVKKKKDKIHRQGFAGRWWLRGKSG